METLIPFRSLLFEEMVSTPAMRAVWSEENTVRRWMDVEAAITRSQARLGLIPGDAARVILDHLDPDGLPVADIRRKKAAHGHLMVAFLKAFRDDCGPAAEHFHVGPTTQDITDTGLVLQIREADDILGRQLVELEETLCDRALAHRDTVMMGRTHQQHAVPLTLGFTLALWAAEVRDHTTRMAEARARWAFASLGGAVGTQSAYVELAGTERTLELELEVCRGLGLARPMIALHSRTDRFVELTSNLAMLCGSLARMGMSIVGLQRSEVAEVEEPFHGDRYGSSTMPNKINPESSEQVAGLASLVRGYALSMHDVVMHDQRDSTRIPVQYTALPGSFMMTARALTTITEVVGGLVVNADRMRANLDHPHVGGQAVAERLMIHLYRKTGKRDWAHTRLHECARRCREQGRPFRDVVTTDRSLAGLISEAELDEIFDPTHYLGTAVRQVEETVRTLRATRAPGATAMRRPADGTLPRTDHRSRAV